MKILLSYSACASFVGKRGPQPPIHSTMQNKIPELAHLFVNRENIGHNTISEECTPLQLAVRANQEELVEVLLTDKRVDPDLNINPRSQTPLFGAVSKNNVAIIQILISADIKDETGFSPAILLDTSTAEAHYVVSQAHSSRIGNRLRNHPSFLHPD